MSLNKLQMKLSERGAVLATRRAGRDLAHDLQERWEGPFAVDLDFDGVAAVTPPFLDELFKGIRSELDSHDGSVVYASNMNEDVHETAKMILERDRSALVYLHDGEVALITEDDLLADTFTRAVSMHVPFTAPDLAEGMELSLQNANARLNALRKFGAVAREKDPEVERGRRFLYLAASSTLLDRSATHQD
jgi:hypothetical protein